MVVSLVCSTCLSNEQITQINKTKAKNRHGQCIPVISSEHSIIVYIPATAHDVIIERYSSITIMAILSDSLHCPMFSGNKRFI